MEVVSIEIFAYVKGHSGTFFCYQDGRQKVSQNRGSEIEQGAC